MLLSPEGKRHLVEPNHPRLSVRRQCELLGLNRSTLYYEPATESEFNLHLMRLIDEQSELMETSPVAQGLDENYQKAVAMLTSPRFKQAFDHNVVFVYGTKGTPEETAAGAEPFDGPATGRISTSVPSAGRSAPLR